MAQYASVHEATAADMADAHGRLLDTLRAGGLKIPDPAPNSTPRSSSPKPGPSWTAPPWTSAAPKPTSHP
ncbi:MAG: hypothetical protein HZY75_11965 [Nocardioidaceae bacterium]|nr:MAG: hypothetical protein HZY75_11965 [Nocardioidaceae bacterium]